MMNFAEAWDALELGQEVRVSDGTQPPSNTEGVPYRAWRSHNFTGRLVERIDGDYRALRIEMNPEGQAVVAYAVAEAVPHTFEAV